MTDDALLSYGQLSVWRDIRGLPRARWHEANFGARLRVPADAEYTPAEVTAAVRALGVRHESLRTVYATADPMAPRQLVQPPGVLADIDVAVVECAEDQVNMLLFGQMQQPFDLSRECSWRARVVTDGGRPAEVLIVRHHITADGGSDAFLEADLRAVLEAGGKAALDAAEPAPNPVPLSEWQHSPARERGRRSTRSHWEKIFTSDLVSLPRIAPAGPGEQVLQCMIRSRRAHESAQRLATRLGVPLPSVVLAAYTWSVARVTQTPVVVVDLMSSNRFHQQWSEIVSSMNQWAAASFTLPEHSADDPATHFVDYVRHVQARGFAAYRHGMYDVDEMADLRERTWAHGDELYSVCAFNFIDMPIPATPVTDDPPGGVETAWEQPFHSIGHPCYLRAIDEGAQALTLRLRTKQIAGATAERVLRGMYELLVAADG
ncbi:MAG TPA: condensation domain-containing protein [Actinocrinis sp.]|uniref:condensation domain-containing protein n=1 Tax=Actinocrinis sp. TaxID=1920516 RepID=UPI002DDDAD79|nr:condensation domain-containing protein [Actinocrinis sp.]HEV2346772.1 condensation domain-containing protein [Actinocrinis sp.]